MAVEPQSDLLHGMAAAHREVVTSRPLQDHIFLTASSRRGDYAFAVDPSIVQQILYVRWCPAVLRRPDLVDYELHFNLIMLVDLTFNAIKLIPLAGILFVSFGRRRLFMQSPDC